MVHLLIVSHSARLAAGVQEFVAQVAGPAVLIGAAGGTADGRIGTSVEQIRAELLRVASPDGVLILVDLKGAVLAVEQVLEELTAVRALISDAPLVEGAYLAGIEAAVGGTLEETAAAALRAAEIRKVHA
jgi:dihydroxyacetone kinase DhaKLM complex PTS-EIIA-like component DhaM